MLESRLPVSRVVYQPDGDLLAGLHTQMKVVLTGCIDVSALGVAKSHGALNLPLWHWGQNFFLSKKKKSFLINCHTKKFHKRESILVKLYILDESHSFNISIFNFRKNLTTFFLFCSGFTEAILSHRYWFT